MLVVNLRRLCDACSPFHGCARTERDSWAVCAAVVLVDGRESHVHGLARIGDMDTEIPKRRGTERGLMRRVGICFDCRMAETLILIRVGTVSYVALPQALIAEKVWLAALASPVPLPITRGYRRGMAVYAKGLDFSGFYEHQMIVMKDPRMSIRTSRWNL